MNNRIRHKHILISPFFGFKITVETTDPDLEWADWLKKNPEVAEKLKKVVFGGETRG